MLKYLKKKKKKKNNEKFSLSATMAEIENIIWTFINLKIVLTCKHLGLAT